MQLADSGKYKVLAVNAGGESQSIADFMVLEPQISPEQIRKVNLLYNNLIYANYFMVRFY